MINAHSGERRPRAKRTHYKVYNFDDFEVDPSRRELRFQGKSVPTEPQVFDLLCLLIEHRDRVLSRDEIAEAIWSGKVVSDSAISSRIKTLRQALRDDGKAQRYIRTAHGRGFRFVGQLASSKQALPAIDPGQQKAQEQEHTNAPVIAVLPFVNLSADAEQGYFSDAISQDIISLLARHRWLAVIARNSTFGYKDTAVDVRQLASKLGADYVVQGSVRRAKTRLRVTVELSDARSGNQIWSDQYNRELDDIFELQDEITSRIAARLEPEIGFAERQKVTRARRTNLEAWDYYHLGVAHFFKFTAQDNLEAQRLLDKSRGLDPQFGEAHAWWAYAVVLGMVYWNTEPDDQVLENALMATSHALSLDDKNAVFYALKARVQLARGEYEAAIAENEMAVSLNPTLAAAHCGLADSLAYSGEYEESVKRFKMAIELSPNDPQRWAFLTYGALALIFKQDYESALQWTEKASVIPNCQYWTWAHQVVALAYLDRQQALQHARNNLMLACPEFSLEFARRKLFFLKREDQLNQYLEGLEKAGIC